MSAALYPLQAVGIKILPYLDEWLICAPIRQQVLKDKEAVINHIQELRFYMNLGREMSNHGKKQYLSG